MQNYGVMIIAREVQTYSISKNFHIQSTMFINMGTCLSSQIFCAQKCRGNTPYEATKRSLLLAKVQMKNLENRYDADTQAIRHQMEQQGFSSPLHRSSIISVSEDSLATLTARFEAQIKQLQRQNSLLKSDARFWKLKALFAKVISYINQALLSDKRCSFENWKIFEVSELCSEIDSFELPSIQVEQMQSLQMLKSMSLFKENCQKTLKQNPLWISYQQNKDKFNENPMPESKVFKNIGTLLDKKYEADCSDITNGRQPKALTEFTLEHYRREKGLGTISMKMLCQLVDRLKQLYIEQHEYGTIICRLLQLFHAEPVPQLLALFLTKARIDYNRLVNRKSMPVDNSRPPLSFKMHLESTVGLAEIINLVYTVFDTDRLCRGTCIQYLKPETVSTMDYLLFRICHKLSKLGTQPEHFFAELDTRIQGVISHEQLVEGIKNILELAIQPEEVQCLFKIMDKNNTGKIYKQNFASVINFGTYLGYLGKEQYAVSLSKFMLALIETYKIVQLKDTAALAVSLRKYGQLIDYHQFSKILLKLDPDLFKREIDLYFEEALSMQGSAQTDRLARKDNLTTLVTHNGIAGKGVRDFRNFYIGLKSGSIYPVRGVDATTKPGRSGSRLSSPARRLSVRSSESSPRRPYFQCE